MSLWRRTEDRCWSKCVRFEKFDLQNSAREWCSYYRIINLQNKESWTAPVTKYELYNKAIPVAASCWSSDRTRWTRKECSTPEGRTSFSPAPERGRNKDQTTASPRERAKMKTHNEVTLWSQLAKDIVVKLINTKHLYVYFGKVQSISKFLRIFSDYEQRIRLH